MKVVAAPVLLSAAAATQAGSNPMSTVLSLVDELTAKITKDGEVEAKAYAEYVEWCDDTSKNAGFDIETAKKAKAKLEASIDQLTSQEEVAGSKIEELAAAIAAADKELKDATVVREKESADFLASEKELMEAISALTRAVNVLEREMAKNPAFAQLPNSGTAQETLHAIGLILDAAALPITDKSKLMALAQTQQDDDDEDAGAPSAATYKTHSSNILDVLEDLKEKAEGQLSDLRKAEVNSRQNFEMLKQSIEDQAAADNKDMDGQKAGKASAGEEKATSEGDLGRTNKDLKNAQTNLATARQTCITVAADHEQTVAGRKEELATIAQARKILADTSSGAVSQTYSFIQASSFRLKTGSDLAGLEVVTVLRKLAKQQHSTALAQLASRVAAVARYGAANGEEPFGKIKGLISNMIAKLEKEAGMEATEKAFCDEQMAKTEFKKGELGDDIAKQTARIDKAAARSVSLKADVKQLQAELGALAKQQAEMDKLRFETHDDYKQAKADLELGLTGVRKAVALLRDYYGSGASMLQDSQPAAPETHAKSQGAGGGIINVLEVCESDFATNLAKEESEEADAQSEYEKVSQENAVTKTLKEQDVKYKTQEAKSQDKTVAEYSADRQTANTELSAVLEYYSKIKDRCIAKPETYAERTRRREAEISGLKQALRILEEETALVQRKHRGRNFRGSLAL